MSGLAKEVKKLVGVARKQGWTVEMGKSCHWRFVPPTGRIVFTGSTPSDQRALKNLRRDLRHQGLELA